MFKKFKACICLTGIITISVASQSFAQTLTVDTKVLNVRSQPIVSSQKIGTIKQNEEYEILNVTEQWVQISINNKEGWVSKEYVKINDEKEINQETVIKQEQTSIKRVTTSILNIREANSTSAKKIGTVKMGQNVNVIETIDNWDKIQVDGITGWVCNTYLIEATQETIVENEQDNQEENIILKTAVINTSLLNVRSDCDVQSKKIGSLKKNAVVAIIGEENGWYKIKYNNQYGYISSDYTVNKDIQISRGSHTRGERPSVAAQTATTLALQYVGCKYVWGGTSPNGFDCSGLVYYVYKDYVPNLGRSARPQATTGTTIEKDKLIMGDLVFFGEDGGKTVTHVGIYVGDGIFVHAANSKRGVVTDSLLSGYYDKNFLHAKRII